MLSRLWSFLLAHPLPGIGLVLGPLIAVGSLIMDAMHLIELGLPTPAWAAIGLGVFFLSVVGILFQWYDQNISPNTASSTDLARRAPANHLGKPHSRLVFVISFGFCGLAVVALGYAWHSKNLAPVSAVATPGVNARLPTKPALTAEDQQFRSDLRGLVTDCVVSLDAKFNAVLTAMKARDPSKEGVSGRAFQYFLDIALGASIPNISNIVNLAKVSLDGMDEKKLQHDTKDYFGFYHSAQQDIYQYNLILRLDLRGMPEVQEWLEIDGQCLRKIQHLRYSPLWTDDIGLPDDWMATVGRRWERPWTEP
jgi:hypothetical protein